MLIFGVHISFVELHSVHTSVTMVHLFIDYCKSQRKLYFITIVLVTELHASSLLLFLTLERVHDLIDLCWHNIDIAIYSGNNTQWTVVL